ncbi:DJ-1 family glyoxalase III [Pelagicoccus sp. SDUM812003]|uniref:DJ-1 family glyoxalase III n=1 Tax=Pelagicoccus sp. SDUM812003 TaxID=3041267 RepID=UPI00280F8B36|nr:DJ-1 family glyoxalase III [Pelagicoccus sp. SDUM812003]MDQ8203720.1 DJ-1/PfpI family protein [Pelagicoccus sp. SDUM812003]
MSQPTPTALVIVFDGIEEIEALTPVDILRRAEIDVTVASVDGNSQVKGRNDITFAADTSLSLVAENEFDLVLLPGGPGVLKQLDNSELAAALKAQDKRGGLLAAICAAPKLLANCGLLNNRSATSHASVRDDLPIASEEPVVQDGHIITSQGVGTAVEFSLALVGRMKSKELADKIAASIHYQS